MVLKHAQSTVSINLGASVFVFFVTALVL